MKFVNSIIRGTVLVAAFSMVAIFPNSTFAQASAAAATPNPKSKDPFALFNQKQQKAPTYVSAEQLSVDNIKRVFEYSGDVEVIQADMLLTSRRLVGTYGEDNQIKTMTAYDDVMITKGEKIRASGNRADYDGISRTFVLTESPELQQEGSILTADRVKVLLDENRSLAEGNVRVKLVGK